MNGERTNTNMSWDQKLWIIIVVYSRTRCNFGEPRHAGHLAAENIHVKSSLRGSGALSRHHSESLECIACYGTLPDPRG